MKTRFDRSPETTCFRYYEANLWLTTAPSYAGSHKITDDDALGIDDKDNPKAAARKKPDGFTVIGSVSDLDKNGYLQT